MGKVDVLAILAFAAAVTGCQQSPHPLFVAGSEFRQTAKWLGQGSPEVVEFTYAGPFPAKDLRRKLGLPSEGQDGEFRLSIGEMGRGGFIDMCFAVRQETIAQWTVVHERLAELGYRKSRSPIIWSYHAPDGLRERAAKLLPEIRETLAQRLKQRFGDRVMVNDGGSKGKPVWVRFGPIDSRRQWQVYNNASLCHRFFPTLALVVSYLPVHLTISEQAELEAILTATLAPLIQMDARYRCDDRFPLPTRPATRP